MNTRKWVGVFGMVSIFILWFGQILLTNYHIGSIMQWIWFFWEGWLVMHFAYMTSNIRTPIIYITLTGAFACIAFIAWTMLTGLYDPLKGIETTDICIRAIFIALWNLILVLDAMNVWGKDVKKETSENKIPAQEQKP